MSATETFLRLHRSWAAAKAAFDTAHAPAQGAIEWLRAAVDALPEGIVFLDPEGRYILWNKRYAEIYAKSADLFQPGARLADTLRIGVERGDYPESAGREEEWIAERLAKLANPQAPHEQRLSDGRWILIEERKMTDGCTIGLRVEPNTESVSAGITRSVVISITVVILFDAVYAILFRNVGFFA